MPYLACWCTYLFALLASLLAILILLNICSSICVTLFCVPLFTLAALCDGIKLIFTMSLALKQKCESVNSEMFLPHTHTHGVKSFVFGLHDCDLGVWRFQRKTITKCSRYHNFRYICIFDCSLENTKIVNTFDRNSLSNPIFTHIY